MKLSEFAIKNYQATFMVFVILFVAGLVAFFTMPRSEDPHFEFPSSVVLVIAPGTTPQDMEKLIVDPIESEINELDDLKQIRTNIEDGMASLHVEFFFGVDAEKKYDDVVAALNKVQSQLPSSVAAIKVLKLEPSDVSMLQLALVSNQADYLELKRHSEALEKKLERVSGVKRVDVDALPDLEVQVQVEQAKVNALGISLAEISKAIYSAAQNIPGGYVQAGERRFTVRSSGDFESLEQLEQAVVRAHGDSIIYLRDIAHVSFTEGLPVYKARFNNQKAVFLSAVQRKGTQVFKVRDRIQAVLDEYQQRLPETIELKVVMDQAESVDYQISTFLDSLNQGLILVALTTLLVLGFKSSLVVLAAIPLSIFIAIGWLDLSGFGLNQVSIIGLVIALGMLVDNAIVVMENVGRHVREGKPGREAAIFGSNQVALSIIAGTITTVLAFVPMVMMQNGSGAFVRAMPVTVIFALAASLLIALTLTPLLSTRLDKSINSAPWLQRQMQTLADGLYSKSLNKALRFPKTTLVIALSLLVGSLSLFPYIGVSLFPKAEKPMLFVNIDLPEGAGFEQTDSMAKQVEALVRQYPIVDGIATNIGRGNPRVYYNTSPSRQKVSLAQLFVTLNTRDLDLTNQFIADLRTDFAKLAGAKVTVKEFMQGPAIVAPVEVRVLGENLDKIQHAASDVALIMEKTAGLIAIENPMDSNKVDLRVDINRDKAALLGIALDTIDQSIRTALVGTSLGVYRDDIGDEYQITLRLSEYIEPQLATFDDIMLATATGQLVPLLQVAQVVPENSLARLQHFNTERMASVLADVLPGYVTARVTKELKQSLDAYHWPEGVYYRLGGEEAGRDEAFGGMGQAAILAVLAIFAVLVLQFKSLSQPLIIFVAIPFAAIGSTLGLLISGNTFSFAAFVGITSLVGIVVNNSIILVDYANQMRSDGMTVQEAIAAAAHTRFIPILLTTVTTIVGLIPLTITGSSMWAPLCWVIVGGLSVSTLMTLMVVPVLYQLFTKETQAV